VVEGSRSALDGSFSRTS